MVDFLLDGAGSEQPVDGDLPFLTNAPRSLPSLHVRAGVPVRVKDDDPIGPNQVDAQPTHTRGQQEHVDGLRLQKE